MGDNNGGAAARREPFPQGDRRERKREGLREYSVGFEEGENLCEPWTME